MLSTGNVQLLLQWGLPQCFAREAQFLTAMCQKEACCLIPAAGSASRHRYPQSATCETAFMFTTSNLSCGDGSFAPNPQETTLPEQMKMRTP